MSDEPPARPVEGEIDVDAVAAATTSCPLVTHLVGGAANDQVATFLPGRRVAGVRVQPDEVELRIAVRWGVTVAEAAAEVRAAVTPLVGGRAIAVSVDDIGEPQAALTGPGAPPPATTSFDGPIAVPSPS